MSEKDVIYYYLNDLNDKAIYFIYGSYQYEILHTIIHLYSLQ